MKKKTEKEKITYIDDGRTIVDMSEFTRNTWYKKGTRSSFRDIWRTYWSATRMMLKPTLIAVAFIAAAFLIISILFYLM